MKLTLQEAYCLTSQVLARTTTTARSITNIIIDEILSQTRTGICTGAFGAGSKKQIAMIHVSRDAKAAERRTIVLNADIALGAAQDTCIGIIAT